jgi:hypothetical protein
MKNHVELAELSSVGDQPIVFKGMKKEEEEIKPLTQNPQAQVQIPELILLDPYFQVSRRV